MCRGAIGEVDVALPVELVGRVEVAGGGTRVAVADYWIDVADVESSTFVPSIGCLTVRRLSIFTFPDSCTELVGGVGRDNPNESLVDDVLPKRVCLALTNTCPRPSTP